MEYAKMAFQTNAGPLVLEFDFIPSEPTLTQLEALAAHNCDTCEWYFELPCGRKCALNQSALESCPSWEIGLDAFCDARIEYYKNLHKKHYG